MLRTLITSTLMLALAAGPAAASTPVGKPQPWDSEEGAVPTALTLTAKCRVKEVYSGDRTVVLVDEEETEHRIRLPLDVPVVAQAKKDFDGRKQLMFSDLKAGQRVKITYTKAEGKILKIQVLKNRDRAA